MSARITAEVNEVDYCIGGSTTAFIEEGEYGPLDDGCCAVATTFDPLGPKLVFFMMRKGAEPHTHTLGEFVPVAS